MSESDEISPDGLEVGTRFVVFGQEWAVSHIHEPLDRVPGVDELCDVQQDAHPYARTFTVPISFVLAVMQTEAARVGELEVGLSRIRRYATSMGFDLARLINDLQALAEVNESGSPSDTDG